MTDKNFAEICLIIPSYQPEEILVKLISELAPYNYGHIVVIDDGSDKSKYPIFERLQQYPNTTVIHHPKNMGKGEALKTGMKWVIKNHAQARLGVITVDADGQHLAKDVARIAESLITNANAYILGIRTFDKQVPWRSRFGNNLTCSLFHLLYKVRIEDTQTGLRGIPYFLMQKFLQIPAERYEFEMACLICAIRANVPIVELKVDTVYINYNASSHFNPLLDSMRIYWLFLRYTMRKKKVCKDNSDLKNNL